VAGRCFGELADGARPAAHAGHRGFSLFLRYLRRDLRPSAYVAAALRIILAMIGVWVIKAVLPLVSDQTPLVGQSKAEQLLVLGFVIGVFPRTAWQFLQGATKRFTPSAILPSLHTDLPISDLDGLTVWHEARLEDEDIENVPNMATADLLELMLNTRFAPERLVDWADQAILYTYLGSGAGGESKEARREKLRAHGIRTATALVELYRKAKRHGDLSDFEQILSTQGRSQIRSLVDAVGTSSNLHLVLRWRGLELETDSVSVGAFRASEVTAGV
jgi:hypothetical protein